MMKRYLTALIFLAVATPGGLMARRGDSAIGGFAGGMVGGLMGGAIANSSSGRSRRAVEHEVQKEKVTQLQREMDKKELETKLEQQRLFEQQRLATMQQERDRSSSLMYILFGVIFFMFLILIGLGVLVINMRKKS